MRCPYTFLKLLQREKPMRYTEPGSSQVASDNAAVVQDMSNLRDDVDPSKLLSGVYATVLQLVEGAPRRYAR